MSSSKFCMERTAIVLGPGFGVAQGNLRGARPTLRSTTPLSKWQQVGLDGSEPELTNVCRRALLLATREDGNDSEFPFDRACVRGDSASYGHL